MVEIQLTKDQTGYDAVDEYIYRYLTRHGYGAVIVRIGVSYDGESYDVDNEFVSVDMYPCLEHETDWWEGQEYIRIYGIQSLYELEISGGIYEEVNK